ncbi:MAG: septum formation initiator family protein [Deltaproteobacteria bacterium]|nr:septum formation initiator family protein [Deltaproteobacteria bacterium]
MRIKILSPKRKVIAAVVCATAIFVIAAAAFGNKGFLDVWRLKKDRDNIQTYNKSLEAENKDLEEKIRLLKTDKRYIAYVARKELGMIGKDEIMYKFEDSKTQRTQDSAKQQ